MSDLFHIDYQCIDAFTPANSWGNNWRKKEYDGFRLTHEGFVRGDAVYIDNGNQKRATHLGVELVKGKLHAVIQQAGPDINLIEGFGSAYRDQETGEFVKIDVIETASNLGEALEKAKYELEKTRQIAFKRVLLNAMGHPLCRNIFAHALQHLDLNDDGFVTVGEYVGGEQTVRDKYREAQAKALLSVLENVFQDK